MNKVSKVIGLFAAGVAINCMADVESANIVGYQTDSTLNSSRLITPTFISVSDDVKKLGDLTPVSLAESDFDEVNFTISFYDNGSKRNVGKDAWIKENQPGAVTDFGTEKVTFYWNQDAKKWFLQSDYEECKYDMSNYPFTPGDGVLVKATPDHGRPSDLPDAGVLLTHAGQVDKLATPVSAVASSVLSGNMTPRICKLGDLTPVSLAESDFDEVNFTISFYDNGSKRNVSKDAWIKENQPGAVTDFGTEKVTFYWNQDAKKWFLQSDYEECKYDMSNYPIQPGEGFLMKATPDHGRTSDLPDAGVMIQFPSAIPAEK